MRKGFVVSSAVMVFVFAVVVALFMFVLNENELHNTAITGLAVEEARWLTDSEEYHCAKYVNTTSSWDANDVNQWVIYGSENFSDQFNPLYTRSGTKTSFSTGFKNLDFLDFFEPYGGFKIEYQRNTPPHIRLARPSDGDNIVLSNGEYEFSIFTCDTDNSTSQLRFWLYSSTSLSGPWQPLRDSTDNELTNVAMIIPPNITANLTKTGLGPGVDYCFKAVASDGQKNSTESIVCNVQIT